MANAGDALPPVALTINGALTNNPNFPQPADSLTQLDAARQLVVQTLSDKASKAKADNHRF